MSLRAIILPSPLLVAGFGLIATGYACYTRALWGTRPLGFTELLAEVLGSTPFALFAILPLWLLAAVLRHRRLVFSPAVFRWGSSLRVFASGAIESGLTAVACAAALVAGILAGSAGLPFSAPSPPGTFSQHMLSLGFALLASGPAQLAIICLFLVTASAMTSAARVIGGLAAEVVTALALWVWAAASLQFAWPASWQAERWLSLARVGRGGWDLVGPIVVEIAVVMLAAGLVALADSRRRGARPVDQLRRIGLPAAAGVVLVAWAVRGHAQGLEPFSTMSLALWGPQGDGAQILTWILLAVGLPALFAIRLSARPPGQLAAALIRHGSPNRLALSLLGAAAMTSVFFGLFVIAVLAGSGAVLAGGALTENPATAPIVFQLLVGLPLLHLLVCTMVVATFWAAHQRWAVLAVIAACAALTVVSPGSALHPFTAATAARAVAGWASVGVATAATCAALALAAAALTLVLHKIPIRL